MKYTYEISQWDVNMGCYILIFCDLNAEAFEKHSTMARLWSTRHRALMEYVSPARRNGRLHFNVFYGHPIMHSNALKYVFCAINRARHGKKIFMELPEDFTLSVQVHQVLIFLQVEECISPMHGHIRQIIRERPLSPLEFGVLWLCLGISAPKIHEFALSVCYERQKSEWSLAPSIQNPRPNYEMVIYDAERRVSSGGETMISQDAEGYTQTPSKNINPCLDPIGWDAEHRKPDQNEHEITTITPPPTASSEQQATIIHQPTTIILARRHSLPSPHAEPIYAIDTTAFRECEDGEPEY